MKKMLNEPKVLVAALVANDSVSTVWISVVTVLALCTLIVW